MPWSRLRQEVTSPLDAIQTLGLFEGASRSGGGYLIRCPAHAERTASCSITPGPDGTIRARCFSCGWTGDLWGLIAARLGEAPGSRELLAAGLELFGRSEWLSEPRDRKTVSLPPIRQPAASLAPERVYPSPEDIGAFWGILGAVNDNQDCVEMLATRLISAEEVTRRDLARAISDDTPLHRGCKFRGWDWWWTTHRLVLPVYDAQGVMRSLRGWACLSGVEQSPKRLPLAGYLSSGLVLANEKAAGFLASGLLGSPLLVVEGEPDYLTWATHWDGAVIGIGSGWWTQEHADRVPLGATVIIATHHDRAGDKYAEEITASLRGRVTVKRTNG